MFRNSYNDRHGNYGRYRNYMTYAYWYLYPSNYRFYHYGCDEDHNADTGKEEKEEAEPELESLVVKSVDFCVKENTASHHTDEYEITEENIVTGNEPQLVVRRGQSFEIIVTTDRAYDKEKDEFTVNLQLGKLAKPSKGTDHRLPLRSSGLLRGKWSSSIKNQDDTVLTILLQAPPDALVGKWKFSIDTKLKKEHDDDEAPKLNKYAHKQGIYILFNPWCKEDQVYMSDEIWRDEAVMNEFGKIYTGNWRQIGSKPWNFGQFEDTVLDCALFLLDKAELSLPARGDPARVVRTFSAIVNDYDDMGVLSGNWSGDYEDGIPPTAWVGSVAILEKYMENKRPVKYGQCWVFSGLSTSLCRALGIPARSVTNFASAHDCDGSITIDKYWNDKGDCLTEFNEDSVWNFHVWNEAWMARPDLPTGYGGWQAFDATPQETSEGAYQAGPCSVAAIKQGFVGFPSDGAFIFAEVNADKVHWVLQKDSTWKTSLDKTGVGRKISTKAPRKKKQGSYRNRWSMMERNPDRLDVTREYKFKEGSEQERASIYRANQNSSKRGIYEDKGDVKFELDIKDETLVGNNFEIKLKMQNRSRNERNVSVKMTLCACYYTGVSKDPLKVQNFDVDIPAIKTQEIYMRVTHEDYLPHVVDQICFKVLVGAKVEGTEQIYNAEDDFRLRRPDVIIDTVGTCKVNEEMKVTLKVINPMPVHLTGCEWQIEGAGIQKTKTLKERDVEPYETIEVEVPLRPRRKGKRQIQASFISKELADVTGCNDVDIEE